RTHIMSRLTFAWIRPMVDAGCLKALQLEDTGELSAKYYPEVVTQRFRRNWAASQASGAPGLIWTTARTFARGWAVGVLWELVGDMVPFLNPILLSRLLGFVAAFNTDQAEPVENGYFYAVAMFAVAVVATLANQQRAAANQHVDTMMEINLVTAIYRKALALSNDARKEHDIGGIITRVSSDVGRACSFVSFWSAFLVLAVVRLVVTLYMLYRTLGWSILVGALAMAVSLPITTRVTQRLGAINKQLMEHRDSRMKIMNDVLSGIRTAKLNAWELPLIQRINKIRIGLELEAIRRYGGERALFAFVSSLLPFIVTFSTYSLYSTIGGESHGPLNPQLVFVTLALLNMLRGALATCTSITPRFVDAKESFRRLEAFLTAGEIDFGAVGRAPYDRDSPTASTSDVLVSVDGGTFKWLSTDEPVLRDIGIKCRRDELVAVIGRVGAGKSSLVSATLGDMIKCAGTVDVCGSIVYVPQQPWIMNATLRDNILFGNRFDQELYDRVVDA
ncbi:hypothetical protein H4R19_006191, partial [Coemansia spiralis]